MDWFLYDNGLHHERVKMGKKWRKMLSPTYSLKFKNIILFLNRSLFFFQMVIFATLFRRCPTLWKSTLKMTTLFRRCLVQRWKTQRCFNVVLRCKFQRWHTQRCFNVDLTLCNVATSYNIKTTLNRRWNVCCVLFIESNSQINIPISISLLKEVRHNCSVLHKSIK